MKQFNVGILGATGAVGQKFINLLQGHPWFTITALGASERSAGKSYAEAVNWIEAVELPDAIASMTVTDCSPASMKGVDFVFSGLDASVATELEGDLARAGIPVISNAKNYRTHPHVPLLVPEVNATHTEMIKAQDFDPSGRGFIVTNPNCVAVPLVMALKPLMDAYGIQAVALTTMQSVSGAGYPGVASLDILGNVIPFISGEEPKIAAEPMKLLGRLGGDQTVTEARFPIDATATRVPTIEGHLLSVKIKFEQKPASADEIKAVLRNWKHEVSGLDLPSSPRTALKVYDDDRFPQPRKNAYNENGMQVGVGRVRMLEFFDAGLVALGHNTCRGAAGVAILNAELLVKQGFIQ
ncbi:MAG: aspartate-semialdehyde dehydrogenase Asd [Bacteroidetes bacterium HLUCCA01]|nr:MAG: aspartate-semialdehyde dehydrogenase Asd [Bacteroidetes bacterium HLUCCA01]